MALDGPINGEIFLASVARVLVPCLRPSDIAEKSGRSIHPVRNQVTVTISKLGRRSQAQLVSLILRRMS